MTQNQQDTLNHFLESLVGLPWFEHAGEPSNRYTVVPDAADGWIEWNDRMLEVWLPRSQKLEAVAQSILGDAVIDEIFLAVSQHIADLLVKGMGDYFERRPEDSETTKCNADLSLWPEIMDSVKRDVAWAGVEWILGRPDFYTEVVKVLREGRWPCAWDGDYPQGRFVVL